MLVLLLVVTEDLGSRIGTDKSSYKRNHIRIVISSWKGAHSEFFSCNKYLHLLSSSVFRMSSQDERHHLIIAVSSSLPPPSEFALSGII